MSTLLLVIGAVVGAVILAIFIVSYLRIARPHSKKIANEQAQLEKRAGVSRETPATGTSKEVHGSKPGGYLPKWSTSAWLSILLIAIGAIVLYGLYGKSPSLTGAVGWSRENWLWVIILVGILMAIVGLNAVYLKGGAWALQAVLLLALFLLFIGLPVWFWLVGLFSPAQPSPPRPEVPLASKLRVAERPKLTMAPGGESERIPVPPGMRVVMDGDDFRFYCVYRDGHEESFGEGEKACSDGDMLFVYARNEREKEANIVSYAYK